MKRKILFIITQSEFGGAQRFLSTLIPKLDHDAYEVLVATGRTGDEHFTEHFQNLGIPTTTIPHLVRNVQPVYDVRALFEIRALIRRFQPHTLFLLSTKAGWMGSCATVLPPRIRGVRVVYRIGGWTFNDPWRWWKKNFYRFMERLSSRWKDVIILNNQYDFNQVPRFHLEPREAVRLIHNGLDVDKMKFLERGKARERLGITAPLVVGTIANFYPSKGLEYLVEAARTFIHRKDIVFVIIGSGHSTPPEAPNVLMPGRIPEASRYLPAFDIFLSPSLKEGFQWAILEAMAAKVPVVATRVGAAPEIIEDGKNGFLVEPGKPEEIAQAIQRLLADDRLRQEFGIQGYQTAREKFDAGKMVREITGLIAEVEIQK